MIQNRGHTIRFLSQQAIVSQLLAFNPCLHCGVTVLTVPATYIFLGGARGCISYGTDRALEHGAERTALIEGADRTAIYMGDECAL